MNKDANKLMEEGWKTRENLDFDKAENLLNQALQLFEDSEDWFNVTEALNHLAYTYKLRAVHHNLKGMEYAKKAEKVAKEHFSKNVLVLRALMSLANSAGLFEQALKWGKECLAQSDKPLSKADVLSHIATFQLRTGNILEAEETINEAEQLMEQNIEQEDEPHRSIWKSKILATKGLILYNKKDTENARKYVTKALALAEKQNLKTRTKEVKAIMGMFE